jgi:hypothetical protein
MLTLSEFEKARFHLESTAKIHPGLRSQSVRRYVPVTLFRIEGMNERDKFLKVSH